MRRTPRKYSIGVF